MIDFSKIIEFKHHCPGCDKEIPGNEPRPSCNECESCFCSEECREKFHCGEEMSKHDYNAPFPEYA